MCVTLTLSSGGCSYQLGSLKGNKDEVRNADVTGSVTARPLPPPTSASYAAETPSEGDLIVARAVAADALAKDEGHASVPWENPNTGARGTITPIASSYTLDGLTCRDFLASYVRDKKEAWLQGEACRVHQGRWEVRSMKPWRRT